jgi:hypothetical protein
MKFFSHGKTHAVLVAGIDGESAAVGMVHVRGTPAEVIAHARTALPHEERAQEQTRTQVVQALRTSAEKAGSLYAGSTKALPLRRAYAIVHPPWTHSKTVVRSVEYEKDTAITPSAIADLAKEAFGEAQNLDTNNLIEAAIVRTELNGYPTAEPNGKRARSLRVSVLLSDCDADMRSGIMSVLGGVVGVPVVMRSGARALLGAMRGSSHPQDCLLVNVTGSATEFLVVRDGGIVEQTTALEGVGSIVRKIAAGALPEQTHALLAMASRDACTSAECEALNAKLAELEPELVKRFGEAFGTVAGKRKLPNTLVLSAPPEVVPWLSHFFGKIDFAQFTLTSRPFDVELLTELDGSVVSVANTVPDPALLSAVALVNTELSS